MPFSGKYDDTYLVAIGPAALESGALPKRADYDGSLGNIVSDIQAMIRAAKVVVADLSESRPNVLHEVGYAEAMRKPVIQICSTPLTQMPFNVRNNHTVEYTLGQTSRLRTRLLHELGKAL
jgi:nucleoside 2-deoxyribosyltransferase